MVIKIKKKKKAVRMRGSNSHGWGFRKKHKGSGHRGGIGMAGTGKRADQKKTLINKLYGNKYFGKRDRGITSLSLEKDRSKVINLRKINEKFKGQSEINLKDFKILGDGDIEKAITITAKAFTKSAKEKIEKAGGKAIVLEKPVKEKLVKKEIKKEITEKK